VELAQSGYYDGTAFENIAANAIAPVGARTGPSTPYPQPEPGRWPHVRGTVALSARESTDARFFINLADTPAFDHEYTIFGQVLNGGDVIDRILEGDIIDDIEILP
jgi:peptidyl-prolyl cis-trans isomerase B (cyclophilin B)